MAATAVVEAENEAEVVPAGTVTEAGTVSEALLTEIVTTAPAAGAAEDRVTVQALDAPPLTDAGVHSREETVGGAGTTGVTVGVLPEETRNSPMTSSELSYPPKV